MKDTRPQVEAIIHPVRVEPDFRFYTGMEVMTDLADDLQD